MEQTQMHPALKIVAFVAIVVVALLILGFALGAFKGNDTTMEPAPMMQDDTSDDVTITTVTSTTTVESDMDAYLKASNSVPSSSDFNDSYSDLNQ